MCGRIRAEGRIRTIGVIALLATAAALAMAGPASATVLDYTFDAGNEGWQQAQDPANGPFVPASFQSSGGNPGGHLGTVDSGPETGCPDKDPCQLLTYYSPFVSSPGRQLQGHRRLRSALERHPSIRGRAAAPPAARARLSRRPDPDERRSRLPPALHPARRDRQLGGLPYVGGTCSPPSQATFQSLIEDSDEIAVIVDVGANGTGETYDLDNVSLTNGGPQPPPPPPKKKKKKKKKCKHKHHRAASAKKHKCKKKKKKRRASLSALRG